MAELQQLVDGLCQRTTAYSDWMNRVERLVDGLETEKAGKLYIHVLFSYWVIGVTISLVVYMSAVANNI